MIMFKGAIGLILLILVLLAIVVSLIIRAKKKSGIKGFLKKNNVAYDELLVAHESQHYVALQIEKKQFQLLKYSEKKKAYQMKTFHYSDLETADFYLDGRRIFSVNASTEPTSHLSIEPNPTERNLVSIRMFIKGIEYPYILSIDQFAEGNGSAISDSNLRKNVGKWQAAFLDMLGVTKS